MLKFYTQIANGPLTFEFMFSGKTVLSKEKCVETAETMEKRAAALMALKAGR